MRFFLTGFLFVFAAAMNALPQGIYTEYKCTLLNGESGTDYTYSGRDFPSTLQYNFDTGNRLKISDDGNDSEYTYTINGEMLTMKRVMKKQSAADTLTSKFLIEETEGELILKEYKEGLNEGYFLKKHYFKKGLHPQIRSIKSALTIYTIVEHMPEFPGGPEDLKDYITNHVVIPLHVKDAKPVEKVFIKLLLAPSGKVEDAEILVHPKIEFAKAAMEVIKKLPAFSPGKMGNEPVYVFYNLPVTFKN